MAQTFEQYINGTADSFDFTYGLGGSTQTLSYYQDTSPKARLQKLKERIQEGKAQNIESKGKLIESKGKLHEAQAKRIEAQLAETRKKKQGSFVKGISKLVGVTPRLRQTLTSSFSGFTGGSSQSNSNRPVGRPRGNYKNPAGVPAQVWYKIQRQQRRLAQVRAEQIAIARQQELAKQGISPNLVRNIQMQRQMQPVQQMPQQVPQPTVAQPQVQQNMPQRSIWNRQGFQDTEVDILGNVRQVTRGRPESFWN